MRFELTDIEIRGDLLRFAFAQESVLQENDGKSHWSHETVGYLLGRASDELGELRRAIKNKDVKKIRKEACDLGNFAMMIYDVADNCERT